MKNKIVIILSRVFPTTHSRRGQETNFANKFLSGEKKHTIRQNYDLWKVNAEKMKRGNFYVSIRQWEDMPYRSKMVEIAKICNPIGIQRLELYYHSDNDTITAKIDGKDWLDADCYTLAKNDGLSVQDFKEYFFGKDPKEDKVFNGCIVHFTDFRY